MCKKIVFFLITFFCFAAITMAANRNFTLVIDAGHGGGDTGAIGGAGVKEKNLTLKFALAFGRLVEQNCPDVKVIYTRKTDKLPEQGRPVYLHSYQCPAEGAYGPWFPNLHLRQEPADG